VHQKTTVTETDTDWIQLCRRCTAVTLYKFADRTRTHTMRQQQHWHSPNTWHLLRPWSFVWDLCPHEIRGWWWWWWWCVSKCGLHFPRIISVFNKLAL